MISAAVSSSLLWVRLIRKMSMPFFASCSGGQVRAQSAGQEKAKRFDRQSCLPQAFDKEDLEFHKKHKVWNDMQMRYKNSLCVATVDHDLYA